MAFWKKLGKVALKAAPIAAAFIPGVGPLASAAIAGATSAASKKAEGGSWKDALLSGGISAGTGYGLGKLAGAAKGAKGIGPSKDPSSFVKSDVAKVAGKVAGGGSKMPSAGTWGKIGMSALGAAPLIAGLSQLKNRGGMGPDDQGNFGPGVYGQYGDFGGFERRNPDIQQAMMRGRSAARGGGNLGNSIGLPPWAMNFQGGGIGPSRGVYY